MTLFPIRRIAFPSCHISTACQLSGYMQKSTETVVILYNSCNPIAFLSTSYGKRWIKSWHRKTREHSPFVVYFDASLVSLRVTLDYGPAFHHRLWSSSCSKVHWTFYQPWSSLSWSSRLRSAHCYGICFGPSSTNMSVHWSHDTSTLRGAKNWWLATLSSGIQMYYTGQFS